MSLFPIDEKGSWITDDPQHCFDIGLNNSLLEFLKNNSVFDVQDIRNRVIVKNPK